MKLVGIQDVHEVFEHALVGVDNFVLKLLVQSEDFLSYAHETFFFALILEENQVTRHLAAEVES